MKMKELDYGEMMNTNGGSIYSSIVMHHEEMHRRNISVGSSGGGGGRSWGDDRCSRDWGKIREGILDYTVGTVIGSADKEDPDIISELKGIGRDHYQQRGIDKMIEGWNRCKVNKGR